MGGVNRLWRFGNDVHVPPKHAKGGKGQGTGKPELGHGLYARESRQIVPYREVAGKSNRLTASVIRQSDEHGRTTARDDA